jgi:cytochrome P450
LQLPPNRYFYCFDVLQDAGTKWSTAIETQLCYEIKTFLLAGHETSAAMLMWSVYELSRNEEAREQVTGLTGWVVC